MDSLFRELKSRVNAAWQAAQRGEWQNAADGLEDTAGAIAALRQRLNDRLPSGAEPAEQPEQPEE